MYLKEMVKKYLFLILFLNAVCVAYLVLADLRIIPSILDNDNLEYANLLRSRDMYIQAIENYKLYLERNRFAGKEKKASIYYTIGDLYMESLIQYEDALAAYLIARHLLEDTVMREETERKIIQCLEHLGRRNEASMELTRKTAIGAGDITSAVARIGHTTVTIDEVNRYFDMTLMKGKPEQTDQVKRIKMYLLNEMLYRKALMNGYDRKKEYITEMNILRKEAVINQYLLNELSRKLNVDERAVNRFYAKHQSRYIDIQSGEIIPLEQCRSLVYADALKAGIYSKSADVYNELADEMEVEIYAETESVLPGTDAEGTNSVLNPDN